MRLPQNLRGTVATLALAAMAVAPLSAALTVLSVDTAYAGNHTGKSNGNGRADAGRPANPGGNGRGAIASELGALNAAHANQQTLENAAPESMPGRLYSYQQTRNHGVPKLDDYNSRQTELTRSARPVAIATLCRTYKPMAPLRCLAAESQRLWPRITRPPTHVIRHPTYLDAYLRPFRRCATCKCQICN